MPKEKTENSKRGRVRRNEADDSTQNNISIRPTARHSEAKTEYRELKVGDKVKLKSGATIYLCNKRFPEECYDAEYYIAEIKGERAVISLERQTGISGSIAGAVYIFDLVKVNV